VNRTNVSIVVIAILGAILGFLAGGVMRHSPNDEVRDASLKIGEVAPPFARSDLGGEAHSLSDWRGKVVLLNFWASWCGPCREEMPLLDRTQKRYADKGLQVVGVASDSAAATKAFLAKTHVDYPILIDDPEKGADLSAIYGNDRSVLPYTALIGRDGHVLALRMGKFSETSLDAWLLPHL
jgi:thiol-disulfide isomerase/thioredoxin